MIRPRIRRLFRLWLRRPDIAARDVDEEIGFHLDLRAAQLMQEGLTPERARAEALRRFGIPHGARRALQQSAVQREGTMSIRETVHELATDVRLAVRGLRRDAVFTAFVVTALALGIGANATMYGIVDRLLLSGPAHVDRPDGLANVLLATRVPGNPERVRSAHAYALYGNLLDGVRSFDALAGYSFANAIIGRGLEARQLNAQYATASFFPLLGVRPAAGRFFSPEEDAAAGAQHVVVIGHALWKDRFGGQGAAMGTDLEIDGERYTIVGVAPPGFTGIGLQRTDLWLPISIRGPRIRSDWTTTWNSNWMSVVGRLKPGVTLERATEEATSVHRASYRGQSPITGQGEVRLTALGLDAGGRVSTEATVSRWLVGVSAVVLVIACLNVTNLLLARAARRRRDMGVRMALGSGRWRVARAVLAESGLLAIGGAAAGLLVASAGGVLVRRLLLPQVDWSEPVVNAGVMLIAAVVTLAVALGVGFVPALQTARSNLTETLKTGEREGGGRRARVRGVLTVAQASFSVVLLVGAGLFVRSLWKVTNLDLGLEPQRVLSVWLQWRSPEAMPLGRRGEPGVETRIAPERARQAAFLSLAMEQIRALPQIEHASLTIGLPFTTSFGVLVRAPGRDSLPSVPGGGPFAAAVADDYFATVGTRIVRGRPLGPGDRAGTERVTIVNETMAGMLWPGQDALGQCLIISSDTLPCARVVGVAANTRRFRLQEAPIMQIYIPYGQEVGIGGAQLVIRPRGDPSDLIEPMRRQLHAMDPALTYVDITVLRNALDPQYRPWRLGAGAFLMCGALALVVAAVGLFSVLTYLVAQRTQEIGVRVALGAQASDVTRLIMKSGIGMVGIGIAAGVGIALGLGRFVQGLLFETSARDPLVLASVAAGMLIVAVLASLLPVAAARKINPIVALRAD